MKINESFLNLTIDFSPVCGSNGKTYNNPCLLELDQCESGENIEAAHQGPCSRRQCSRTEFRCSASDVCISYLAVCDGSRDCEDASDEANCEAECRSTEFRCADSVCVPFR